MKRLTTILLCGAMSVSTAAAAEAVTASAALAAVRELGTVNGQALACGHRPAAVRAKSLMLAHSPRTFEYGNAFEEETNKAFTGQTRRPAEECPDASSLARRLDALAASLGRMLPAQSGERR